MKIGDSITIEFHSYGLKLDKTFTITEVNEDNISVDENGTTRKFCLLTGKCLNDTRYKGGRRQLKLPIQN